MAFSSATLQTLGDLLADFHFHVPDYQRGYSWGKAQLEALWADLRIAVNSPARQHFTGNVLLQRRTGGGEGMLPVDLVDGQQRVVSTIALAAALTRRIFDLTPGASAPALPYRVKFEDSDELQTYFDFFVLDRSRLAPRLAHECSSYAANIQHAAAFFKAQADELPDVAAAQACLDTLLGRFCIFVLDVQPEFDIHVAFETLNNRGKKLSHLELLKNRLIYLSSVVPAGGNSVDGDALRRQIHLAWKGIYRSLGRNKATQNHDDEFLRAHSIAYFGEVKDRDWLEKVLLDETFTVTNPELSRASIGNYIHHLETAAVWWAHMHGTDLMPSLHRMRLAQIARVGDAFFKPLMLAAYIRIAEGEPAMALHPSRFERALRPALGLLEQVERYVVLLLTLSGRPSHLGRADMNRMARALMRPSPDFPSPSGDDFSAMDGPAAVDVAAAYVRNYVNEEFSAQDVQQQVAARLRSSKHTGYYRWSFTKVLLLEFEEARRADGNKPIALKWPWDKFSFDSSVEHIYPNAPDQGGYWDSVIQIHGNARALKQAVVNSLGNLMLLSVSRNASVSNLPFAARNGGCKRSRYAVGSHSETQVANAFKSHDWNVACIAARGIAMLKYAEERWNFSLTDDPDDNASYLPMLFGHKAEEVRAGSASGDKRIDNRALNPLVKLLDN